MATPSLPPIGEPSNHLPPSAEFLVAFATPTRPKRALDCAAWPMIEGKTGWLVDQQGHRTETKPTVYWLGRMVYVQGTFR